MVHAGKKGLGSLVFAQLIEHGTGEVQYCRVRGLNASHLFQSRFSEGDAPFAGVESRQLRPSGRVIAINLDHGFECLVSDTTLVTFDRHQANQKMGGSEIRAL